MAVLDYLEMPATQMEEQKSFFTEAFGWKFTSYGDRYAAHEEGPCQLGMNGTGDHTATGFLPVIRVAKIEEARDAVGVAGGDITVDIFSFPGGRRFHFTEPSGMEMACYEPDA